MDGFINDEVTEVTGDGIVTYYKNVIYINYKINESNKHTREA